MSLFPNGILSEAEKEQFHKQGYLVVREVLNKNEINEIMINFMKLHEQGPIPGYFEPLSEEEANGDPLKLYPRMLYPHRINETAKKYMLHTLLLGIIADLFDEEPLAAQSMFYFKPMGARGQALHQDNYYLQVYPGTCIAAWIAIDPADQENGGLVVVPETNMLEIQCPHLADVSTSFFRDEVDIPENKVIVPVDMGAGDVLFFNGSTIHGSFPNYSKDRFRRAFICHYVGASTLKVGSHINEDLYNYKGEVIQCNENKDGGPCGTEFEGAAH